LTYRTKSEHQTLNIGQDAESVLCNEDTLYICVHKHVNQFFSLKTMYPNNNIRRLTKGALSSSALRNQWSWNFFRVQRNGSWHHRFLWLAPFQLYRVFYFKHHLWIPMKRWGSIWNIFVSRNANLEKYLWSDFIDFLSWFMQCFLQHWFLFIGLRLLGKATRESIQKKNYKCKKIFKRFIRHLGISLKYIHTITMWIKLQGTGSQ
jgi:hypothetical protein